MTRGNLIMGLRPMAPAADRFHPDRAGLDHLSFNVPGREDLEALADGALAIPNSVFLPKPFSLSDLIACVENQLTGRPPVSPAITAADLVPA